MLDGLIDLAVDRLVETLRLKEVAHGGVGILFKHQRAQNRLFELSVGRLLAPSEVIEGLALAVAPV